MAGRKEGGAAVLELVVTGERKTDSFSATLPAALADELPSRRMIPGC